MSRSTDERRFPVLQRLLDDIWNSSFLALLLCPDPHAAFPDAPEADLLFARHCFEPRGSVAVTGGKDVYRCCNLSLLDLTQNQVERILRCLHQFAGLTPNQVERML